MKALHILSFAKSRLGVHVSVCGLEQRIYIGAVDIGKPDAVQFASDATFATCKRCTQETVKP